MVAKIGNRSVRTKIGRHTQQTWLAFSKWLLIVASQTDGNKCCFGNIRPWSFGYSLTAQNPHSKVLLTEHNWAKSDVSDLSDISGLTAELNWVVIASKPIGITHLMIQELIKVIVLKHRQFLSFCRIAHREEQARVENKFHVSATLQLSGN
jgi:hypothetical protein